MALGAQWVQRQTDEGLAFAASNALSKIIAVLPVELRDKVDDRSFHVSREPPKAPAVDLQMLREAMREQRKLRITYRDPKAAETERVIWPIMLGFFRPTAPLLAGASCERTSAPSVLTGSCA